MNSMARESKYGLGKPTKLPLVAWKEKFPHLWRPDAGVGGLRGIERSGDDPITGTSSCPLTRVDRWFSRRRYRVLRRDATERILGSQKEPDRVEDIELLGTLNSSLDFGLVSFLFAVCLFDKGDSWGSRDSLVVHINTAYCDV